MKIIDLLNKIVNGEELPKKIRYEYKDYVYKDNYEDYYCEEESRYLFETIVHDENWKLSYTMNIEVKILEEEKKFTKEDFIKEAMDLEDITREEFNKRYEVKECNCGMEYCKGFIRVEKVQEEKKIPEKLDWNKNEFIYPEGNLMIEATADMLMEIQDKVNFILDHLKSKGDE